MCAASQLPANGAIVIPISLPYIYGLSTALSPLRSIEQDTALNQSIYILWTAENTLNSFLTQSVYSASLKATVAPGIELLTAIKKLTTDANKERILDFLDTYSLVRALDQFETVLTAEMNVGNAYLVTKKRGYDTSDLIKQAEVLFPSELIWAVPESLGDIREAGRCIAFELATAAGFHIMRATELVLRRYFDMVTNGAARPDRNNIGEYLAELDKLQVGDTKTRATLRQIKDLHRNELMHPEVSLSLDEALALLGIAQSAIVAMLREMSPLLLPPPVA